VLPSPACLPACLPASQQFVILRTIVTQLGDEMIELAEDDITE
jgi:hypothetical protein